MNHDRQAGLFPNERKAKLFKNGRSQAVRIPREFEFAGSEVIFRRQGDQLLIMPAERKSLLELLVTLEPLGEEDQMPPIDDPPPQPFDL